MFLATTNAQTRVASCLTLAEVERARGTAVQPNADIRVWTATYDSFIYGGESFRLRAVFAPRNLP